MVSLRTTATVKNTCSILLAALILVAASVPGEEAPYTQILNVVYAEPDGVGLLLDVFTPLPGAGPAKAEHDNATSLWSSSHSSMVF